MTKSEVSKISMKERINFHSFSLTLQKIIQCIVENIILTKTDLVFPSAMEIMQNTTTKQTRFLAKPPTGFEPRFFFIFGEKLDGTRKNMSTLYRSYVQYNCCVCSNKSQENAYLDLKKH